VAGNTENFPSESDDLEILREADSVTEADTDVGTALDAVRAAVSFDWTWDEVDVERFSSRTGWSDIELPDPLSIRKSTNSHLNYPLVQFDLSGNRINLITFNVAEVDEFTVTAHDALVRAFPSIADRLGEVLGPPVLQRGGASSNAWWQLPGFIAYLTTLDKVIALSLVRPDFIKTLDYYKGPYSTDTQEHDWPDFTNRLASTLVALPVGAKIILLATGNRYTQFAQSDSDLYAEITSGEVLENPPPAESEAVLDNAGWNRPQRYGNHHGNWYRSISWPARSAAYRALADAVTVGLRDALGVRSPAELKVSGWVDGTSAGYLDLSWLKPVVGSLSQH
jgi:hypothetical protein